MKQCECTEKKLLEQVSRGLHGLTLQVSELTKKVETITTKAEELFKAVGR